MPGYIGYTPQFKPISLQEYLAVPEMIINDYKEAEKEFNEYQDKVAAVEALAGNNEKAMNIINQYKNYLGEAADSLNDNGVKNSDNYRAAKNARNYYRNSVMKLEPAIKNFQEAQKTRAAKDDGTLIGPELKLDSYIENPLHEDRFVHGSAIQAEAMKAAAAASARRKSEKKPTTAMGGEKWAIGYEAGFSPEELQAWLKDPSTSPELTTIANQIAAKYGEYDPYKVGQYITRGIVDGIAYDNKTVYQDREAWNYAAAWNNKKKEIDYKFALANSNNSGEQSSVTRLPQRFNPIEGSNSKASEYNEFKQLLDEVKANPSILNTEKPNKTIAQITQYANASDKNKQKENAKLRRQWDYYNKKQRFIELRDKIAKERGLNSNMRIEPTGTGVTYNDVPNYKLIYDNRFDNLVSDIAEKSVGYTFDVTPAANEQIFNDMIKYTGANADGENSFILDEDGDKVDNSDIRKLDPNKTQYIIEDGIMWMISDGERYIVEPGAFGPMDAINRKQIKTIYDSGDIDTYNDLIQKHMDNISLKARTKAKGQSNTDSKISLDE